MRGSPRATSEAGRAGVLYAVAAFTTWGLIGPVHLKLLSAVPALELMASRVVFASLLAIALVAIMGLGGELRIALASTPRLGRLCLSAGLIGLNWLLYIWAIQRGQLVEASLGYFINPLVNVVLGVVLLGERLRPLQTTACILAALGVLVLVATTGTFPWIALTLALSFGWYGLIRKFVPVAPLVGFTVECFVLLVPAGAYLAFLALSGEGSFLQLGWHIDALIVLTGASTAAPLIWFAAAARRLKLSTVGLLQYISPSCTLLLGVLVYNEPFTGSQAVTFGAIWAGLALYSLDALRT